MDIRRRELLKKSIVMSITLPLLVKLHTSSLFQPLTTSRTDIDLKKIGNNSYLVDGWVLKNSDILRP